MSTSWLYSVLLTLTFLPNTAAFEWDDFTNNLATDLGPVIALFGEQVSKQFLSESLTTWDNIIFAVAPLGILTAVVSAIRVCGSPSLRAFIGRAQEGPGIAEVELLSCTSETTSELWNQGGIARVFGRPQILEVVRTTNKDKETCMRLFDQACGQLKEDASKESASGEPSWIVERDEKTSQFDTRGHLSPNLSLNFGIKRLRKAFTYGAAILGLTLQIGVLVYAGLTAYRFPQNFLLNDKPIERYAFPLTFSGTLLVCCGMFLCAYIIENQTDEIYYKRNHQVTSQLYWIQPGGQKIGDQVFEAFVGKSDDAEYIRSSRTDRDRPWVEIILWTAVVMTTIGFVVQFIGLRGMHSSVTVAQLISTLIMAVVRAGLRTQRMDNNRDIIACSGNDLNLRKKVIGHELDFLALHLEDISAISICTQRLEKRSRGSSLDKGGRALKTRFDLAGLTSGIGDHSWHSNPVKQMATRLQSVIDGARRVLQLPLPHSPSDKCILLEYTWKSEPDGKVYDSSFTLNLRNKSSIWKVDVLQLEALLGVWAWSLCNSTDSGDTASGHGETARLITLDSSGTQEDNELWYKIWIQRDLSLCSQSHKDTQKFGFQDVTPSHEMLVYSQNQTLMMCAQDIFALFLAVSLERVGSLKGETRERKVAEGDSFRLQNDWIEEMADCFADSGMGTKEDAYMCIIPVLKQKHKMPGMNEGLQLAAKKGCKEETRVLAAKGADVNAEDDEGSRPLHLAVLSKEKDTVEILIEKGASINESDRRGQSALHVASKRGYHQVVEVLVKKRADTDIENKEGWSALHIAAEQGHKKVVEVLVVAKADLNKKNKEEWSALHIAAEKGHIEVVRMLTQEAKKLTGKGADVNMKNKEGLTALHLAVVGDHNKTVAALTEAEADVNTTDGRGWSALHIAAEKGYEEVMKTLVKKGADLDMKNMDRWSAPHIAADQGHEGAVEGLLEEAKILTGKRVEIDQKDKEGWTPLHLGVIMAHKRITEILVERGANIYAKNDQGWMALHLAAERGLADIVETIVRMGVSVDATMEGGWTALHLAAARGHDRVVGVLMKKDADISIRDTRGWTPMKIAAEEGHDHVVKMLQGVEVEAKRDEGVSSQNGRSNSGLSMDDSHESSQQANTITIPVRDFPSSSAVSRFGAESEYVGLETSTSNTITIPCHHIRIGDILVLRGRPCQVIRITTSSQTGQHRYLGVDLFTKQLHEESSFISNPAPSVVVQNMLGPVFKQYRVLDIREDGRVVAMTEGGDVKRGLPVLDQGGLSSRLIESFDSGKGTVRVLIVSDNNLDLIVDYKVVSGRL